MKRTVYVLMFIELFHFKKGLVEILFSIVYINKKVLYFCEKECLP